MRAMVVILTMLTTSQYVLASDTTYNAVVSGKKCQETRDQDITCSYKVGKSLLIEISGIGSPTTGIAFLKSNYKGDYYAKYGLIHGCIIVNSSSDVFSYAFISPKNGKVYRHWQDCKSGL